MKAILLFQDRTPWIKDGDLRYDDVGALLRCRAVSIYCVNLADGLAQAREHETPRDNFVNCLPIYEEQS